MTNQDENRNDGDRRQGLPDIRSHKFERRIKVRREEDRDNILSYYAIMALSVILIIFFLVFSYLYNN